MIRLICLGGVGLGYLSEMAAQKRVASSTTGLLTGPLCESNVEEFLLVNTTGIAKLQTPRSEHPLVA